MVVSFTGSSWMRLWPVPAAQSTSSLRSLNSPTPKLSLLRSENTGMAVPAPRHGALPNTGSRSRITIQLPLAGTSAKKWFGPVSQQTGRPVLASRMTNLYSKGSFTSRNSDQRTPFSRFIGRNSCQFPNSGPLPVIASTSPVRTCEAATTKAILPVRFPAVPFFLNITSVKALVRNGESAGLSCQQSLTSSIPGFLPEGSGRTCPSHSLRMHVPSLRTSKVYSSFLAEAGTSTEADQIPPATYPIGCSRPSENTRHNDSPGDVKYSRLISSFILQY